ncbi:hypothetical protein OG223_26460 [Streptomyces sp. NBC_01478]|uniref:hypothetical protein n=1 Tax=Streptomyces sp. NBC_01478 TaxID=2903882 RepID=UPI002E37DFEB|nr:hypothetical protein [Streptomyces sp. NBC_01478]
MNLRLLALAGVAVCAVALPLAVASAGPVRDEGHAVVRSLVRSSGSLGSAGSSDASGPAGSSDDDKVPSAVPSPAPSPVRSPLTLGLGLATAARCGPELSSPDGIEAQTCVMTQGEDTWARTYYRNATGDGLDAVLSLMGPADRTVQMRCVVEAEDEPALCETPRERTQGEPGAYTAVAEFAGRGGNGPLLLRSGSNSPAPTAS